MQDTGGTARRKSELVLDIAIVGGGIAGLYAAYRLATSINYETKKLRIGVFESSKRFGGRLNTVTIPGLSYPVEFGAMRYAKEQELISQLVNHLSLPTEIFDMGESKYFVRGELLSDTDLKNAEVDPSEARTKISSVYRLSADKEEFGKLPGVLVVYAIQQLLENLEFPTLKKKQAQRIKEKIHHYFSVSDKKILESEWETISNRGEYQGIRLYNTGFWNVLQHFLGSEAALLIHDGFGYESVVGNWNAAEAIRWYLADFNVSGYRMIKDGFSGITKALQDRLRRKQVSLFPEHLLKSVFNDDAYDLLSKSDLKLVFDLPPKKEEGNQFEKNLHEQQLIVKARNVILALPRRALEKIKFEGGIKWEYLKRDLLETSHPHRLFKLFLAFEQPWWTSIGDRPIISKGKDSGRVFTDLPLRQVYYYGPSWFKDHSLHPEDDKKSGLANGGLIMASYSDSHFVSFWYPFLGKLYENSGNRNKKAYSFKGDYYIKYSKKRAFPSLTYLNKNYVAPKRMVDKVLSQLAELHGITDVNYIPRPIIAIYKSWGDGGWHTWEVNTKPWEVSEKVIQPFAGLRLYICGEAYSTDQGWVEGALKTVERVMERLHIPPPDWLEKDTTLKLSRYIRW